MSRPVRRPNIDPSAMLHRPSASMACGVARIAGALAAIAMAASALMAPPAFAGSGAKAFAVAHVRDTDLPARLCLAADARTLAQAQRGEVDLVLELRHRTPVDRYSGAFTLSLVDGEVRRPLHVFGMQPDPREGGRAQPQRFRIVVRDVALTPDARGGVCFELDAARDASMPAADTMLEIDLRWASRSAMR